MATNFLSQLTGSFAMPEARGCAVLDGMGMLVDQGGIAVRYWSGLDVDPGAMRRAVEHALGIS